LFACFVYPVQDEKALTPPPATDADLHRLPMCGRYARFTRQHLYSQQLRAADMGTLSPRHNIAPSQALLVARSSEWDDYRELATLY
jgi:hypothetical protein